jgi:tetratricopeptide (TPR) repeat protein
MGAAMREYVRRDWTVTLISLAATFALTQALSVEAHGAARSSSACTSAERWELAGPSSQESAAKKFVSLVSQTGNLPRAYGEAYLLRSHRSQEVKALAGYLMARVLHRMGMIHLAHRGFNQVIAEGSGPEALGAQVAALDCLNKIQREFPTLYLDLNAAKKVVTFPVPSLSPRQLPVVQEAGFLLIKGQVLDNSGIDVKKQALKLLEKSPPYYTFARALTHLKQGEYPELVMSFKRYFGFSNVPDALRRFNDTAHLLLARALFEFKQYDQAIDEFKKVSTDSNYFPKALSDVSWAYLHQKRYKEAMGTAISLHAGALSKTFSPEGPVVMAITLFELCLYPEALDKLNLLKRRYIKPYNWLYDWSKNGGKRKRTLYQDALAFHKKKSSVPPRVAIEWFRSTVFQSTQNEINLTLDEREQTKTLLRQLGSMRTLAKANNSAMSLRGVMQNFLKETVTLESRLVERINFDIADTNRRMLSEMGEVIENARLIEVEVFNSAGDELIKKNARPDLFVGKNLPVRDPKAPKTGTWNWGSLGNSLNENSEVWEDELGALMVDLTDKCPKKGT